MTVTVFALGRASAGRELMVFDWEKAAAEIKAGGTLVARAGLRSDWEWTGGEIYANGMPREHTYTFLASTWAVPELDLDGKVIECYRMQSEVPNWDAHTYWPEEALRILYSVDVS